MSRLATVAALVVLASSAGAIGGPRLAEAAPITPEFAQGLYARVAPLREADGCRLTRFDTSRFQIAIGIAPATGAEQLVDVGSLPAPTADSRTAGDWWLTVPAALARNCPTTVAAIERTLGETSVPRTSGWRLGGRAMATPSQYAVLAITFLVLVLGTAYVLYREAVGGAVPARGVGALLLVCAAALGLRLTLSPQTFLHEYYHIAETVPAYFSLETVPGYGKTGPALFRLVRWMVGSEDVRVIFRTNAVVSSLAIPAAAMLVLAVFGSWPQAVCAALLLAVLPQHLRFSAAEDLFVQAIAFGLWSLALFASYLRTRRLTDALLGALAATLATQARPDMIFFPLVVIAFFVCVAPGGWRLLFARRTLVAGALFALLLVPHVLDVMSAVGESRSPSPRLPSMQRYLETLLLFDPSATPVLYQVMIAAGAAWWAIHRRGWLLWIVAVYVGFTVFTLSIFDNPPWRLRAQNLPMSYLVLLGAGVVPLWTAAWRSHRERGAVVGTGLLVLAAVGVVAGWSGFVGALKDQQLEWAFLERHVSQLPPQGTLLTAVDAGGHNLDAFPEFLLAQTERRYELVDVRKAANGTAAWPSATGDLLFYQGMFCYFAFQDEPSPDPMTPVCRAVHERYVAEPLMVEDLNTEGYSALNYAQGGRGVYRIGFYRLTPRT